MHRAPQGKKTVAGTPRQGPEQEDCSRLKARSCSITGPWAGTGCQQPLCLHFRQPYSIPQAHMVMWPMVHQHLMCDSVVPRSIGEVSSPHWTGHDRAGGLPQPFLAPSASAGPRPRNRLTVATPHPALAGSLASSGPSWPRSCLQEATQLSPQLPHRSRRWPIRLHSRPSRLRAGPWQPRIGRPPTWQSRQGRRKPWQVPGNNLSVSPLGRRRELLTSPNVTVRL